MDADEPQEAMHVMMYPDARNFDAPESRNPFQVESPEKLSAAQVVSLFIGQYTKIETIKQRKHTFIWGSRGSGKSMMLRYLEPHCQALAYDGGLDVFLAQSSPFLAVYCPCKEGQINRTELELLPEDSRLIISEHMLNLTVATRLVECLRGQLPSDFFTPDEPPRFVRRVLRLFDMASIASSAEQARLTSDIDEDPFGWLQEVFDIELRKVSAYLRRCALSTTPPPYEGATSGYHDFLLPLFRSVQGLHRLTNIPTYILLDDTDRLTALQQRIVNTWVANRDHAIFCIKICAQREDQHTFTTRDGGMIENVHDFSSIDVDAIYTRNKSEYSHKVRLIAEKRLEIAGLQTRSIEEFLPSDPTESRLLETIKKETAKEWDVLESGNRPGRKSDYVTRYAIPRLFQYLNRTKKRKSYAGFHNMVDLSSGVVRDFLEPCYLMFDRCVSEGKEAATITYIPPSTQDAVLFEYSQELLLQRMDEIRKELPPDQMTQVDRLSNLINALGILFFGRLHDPKARESRLFSFTVRGQPSAQVQEVLRLGARYRYFQVRTYSTKEGGGREYWYILNRRLCPVLKLDPSGFEGRISLKSDDLDLAINDPRRFATLRLKRADDDSPSRRDVPDELAQLAFFELVPRSDNSKGAE